MQRGDEVVHPSVMNAPKGGACAVAASVDHPVVRISASDLDVLMGKLEVRQIELEQSALRNERRFEHGDDGMTRLYFGICGSGSLTTANGLSIAIAPHTLVVVPPVAKSLRPSGAEARDTEALVAGNARILCGRFHAAFGDVVDMFGGLSVPIVERFSEGDDLPTNLKLAAAELEQRQPGSVAMASLLVKQAIVLLLRRSMTSSSPWVERLAILRDHRISKAFAEMAAKPGAPHTLDSLARTACLSRSTFMARFHELMGRAPMSVLRDLRMRQAAQQLRATWISIGQVGQAAGYANNSSFIRAFRSAYGVDPRNYRRQSLVPDGADVLHPVFDTDPPKESRSC